MSIVSTPLSGESVKFAYVLPGQVLPANPDPNTLYFLHDQQEFYVGDRLISNVSDISSGVAEYLEDNPDIINDVLEAHPEWTTTVTNGSISTAKLANGAVTTAKLANNSVTLDKADRAIFGFRGEFSTLNITSLNQCKLSGFYRWSTSDISVVADMPSAITAGGLLLSFPNTTTSRWQILMSSGVQLIRYNADNVPGSWRTLPTIDDTISISGAAADAGAVNDKAMLYRGNIISKYGQTDINNCIHPGFYRWSTADIANLSHLPSSIDSGGLLIVYPFGTNVIWQMIITTNCMFVRYPESGTWHTMVNRYATRLPQIRWTNTSSGNDSATETINIYHYQQGLENQTDVGRIVYSFYRSTSQDVNSDVYRLGYVYKNIEGTNTRLTRQSEWECALSVNNQGYIGGYIHGGENTPTMRIWVDGVEKTKSELSTNTEFSRLKMISTSDIYSGSTKICEHAKEYTFEGTKLIIKQSLNWVANVTVNNCYLSMIPPLKTLVSEYNYNSSLAVKDFSDLGSDYNVTMVDASECEIFGDDIFMAGGIGRYWPDNDTSNRPPFISDHDSDYHKFYFPAADNTQVTAGDVWKSESYVIVH